MWGDSARNNQDPRCNTSRCGRYFRWFPVRDYSRKLVEDTYFVIMVWASVPVLHGCRFKFNL